MDEMKAKDMPVMAVSKKTRDEHSAVSGLYKGLSDFEVSAIRDRALRARGAVPEFNALGTVKIDGTRHFRNGDKPESPGIYTVEYRPDEPRSMAMSSRGVAVINKMSDQREELTHLLNPTRVDKLPGTKIQKIRGDSYRKRAELLNEGVLPKDDPANYYVYGSPAERSMAMAVAKQAIAMGYAESGKSPVELTTGKNIVSTLDGMEKWGFNPPPFIQMDGEKYRIKGDKDGSEPGNLILREYYRLMKKTKEGEKLNEVEEEAWRDISDPTMWDKVVKNSDARSADVRAATKGGDGGNETAQVEAPVQGSAAPVSDGGPRIVINPSTFHNEKDALCVAYNEALRIVMEENGFDPVSEPTDAQREFFADTAYADDELMLRRTILARICVFDTSVKDPTDEQLEEAVEFLETVMEIGAPQNAQEQSVVQRARDIILRTLQGSRQGREAQGAGSPSGDRVERGQEGNPSASARSEEGTQESRPEPEKTEVSGNGEGTKPESPET